MKVKLSVIEQSKSITIRQEAFLSKLHYKICYLLSHTSEEPFRFAGQNISYTIIRNIIYQYVKFHQIFSNTFINMKLYGYESKAQKKC